MNTSRRPGRPSTGPRPGPRRGPNALCHGSLRESLRAVGVLLAAAGLLVSGCSSRDSATGTTTVAALPAHTPKALSVYYEQKLTWHACTAPGFQCAVMKAPLDYAKPGSGDIRLAVARKKAAGPGKRIGSLLVNPGGPGGSAIGYLQSYAALGYPPQVRARYDMVAVDPRGVAHSEPVTCLDGKQMDAFTRTDVTPDNQAERDRLVSAYKAFAAACSHHSAKVLPHVSTREAARDMDVLRAVLGDRKLTYVGASYGTFLGAMYAGLYPNHVGRLVLDGAMDPGLSARRMNLDQTVGFETAFQSFAQDCAKRSDCPLRGTEDTGAGSGDTSTRISIDTGRAGRAGNAGNAGGADKADRGGRPARRAAVTPAEIAEIGKHLKSFFDRLDSNPLPADSSHPGTPGGTADHPVTTDKGRSTHTGDNGPRNTPATARTTRTTRTANTTDAKSTKTTKTAKSTKTTKSAENGGDTERGESAENGESTEHGVTVKSGRRRMLSEALATTGVIAAMYDEGAWPQLREALTAAMKDHDGSGLLALSDAYYERGSDGRYANLMAANAAVNCLDLPPAFTSPDQVRRALPAFRKASPVFGEGLAWASLTCAYWPVRATGRPHRIEAKGAAPIVVVGTVRDPATPYTWARSLASQLDSAKLLTYDGDGHTAYGRGSTCIDGTINRYLVSGTAPMNGKRCS